MYTSFAEIKTALSQGTSAVEITNYYLAKIEATQHLNAFLEVFKEDALAQATSVDEKIKNGTAGKLAGMVIGLKDNMAYKGHHVAASSKILEGFESLYTATSVERLIEEDAIINQCPNSDRRTGDGHVPRERRRPRTYGSAARPDDPSAARHRNARARRGSQSPGRNRVL